MGDQAADTDGSLAGSEATSSKPRAVTGPMNTRGSGFDRIRSLVGRLRRVNQVRSIRTGHGGGGSGGLTTVVRGACFWSAVVLPLLYVPLLFVGIDTHAEALWLVGLLALNALSLLGGHSYGE